MRLTEYIREIGIEEFAKRHGVKERTALAYQYGARRPRAKLAQRIVENSPVTWEGIYSVATSSGRSRRQANHSKPA